MMLAHTLRTSARVSGGRGWSPAWGLEGESFVLFWTQCDPLPQCCSFNSSIVCGTPGLITFKCVCTTCTLRYSEVPVIVPAHYAVDRIIQRRAGDGIV